ncbi:MAG: 50S ribosomal protein L4 [Archaeoglobi archaeon]|nr:50S ribosomal protein L4 [Candidatus Mnemosynella sp.]
MKGKLLDSQGKEIGEIELPPVFETEIRPDVIKKAVLAAQANRRQPYGSNIYAGVDVVTEYWGTGYGIARVPRMKNSRRAALAPMAVGGRRAHPPKPEKKFERKINKKERILALKSAIAATANEEYVRNRGHRFTASLPIIVEEAFEELSRTKDVLPFLEQTGIIEDISRVRETIKIRAGKGKMRGRRYKERKSALFVISDAGAPVRKALRNLPGVDVIPVSQLNVELLAPGTHYGRLTVWSLPALKQLEGLGWS